MTCSVLGMVSVSPVVIWLLLLLFCFIVMLWHGRGCDMLYDEQPRNSFYFFFFFGLCDKLRATPFHRTLCTRQRSRVESSQAHLVVGPVARLACTLRWLCSRLNWFQADCDVLWLRLSSSPACIINIMFTLSSPSTHLCLSPAHRPPPARGLHLTIWRAIVSARHKLWNSLPFSRWTTQSAPCFKMDFSCCFLNLL